MWWQRGRRGSDRGARREAYGGVGVLVYGNSPSTEEAGRCLTRMARHHVAQTRGGERGQEGWLTCGTKW
jgi:hypothetical protein